MIQEFGSTAFLTDPLLRAHTPGADHPESPARIDAALRGIAPMATRTPRERTATIEELLLCHKREYIEQVEADLAAGRQTLTTGDTDVCAASLGVAKRAVGMCLTAVDLVMTRGAKNAFCITRPPGHHATAERGMGFCLFNNLAIAARYAKKKYGAERVLIADWDVHHGNGTQEIFYHDRTVFYFSTHQWPWYPGTGSADETGDGLAEGTTMNCPFEAGAGRDEILGAFADDLGPEMREFQPDLILLSAGFDSRAGDPLGHFQLTDTDFGDLTHLMMEMADRYCGGRLISALEGGYSLPGLESAVRAHAQALAGRSAGAPKPEIPA